MGTFYRRFADFPVATSDSKLSMALDLKPTNQIVSDLSGNGNAGALNASIVFNYDYFGPGCVFSDIDAGILVADSVSLEPTTHLTISMWIKPFQLNHATGSNNPQLVDKSGSYSLSVTSTGQLQAVVTGLSPTTITTGSNKIVNGLIHHVALCVDTVAGWRGLYINGELAAEDTPTGTITQNNNDLYLGYSSTANYSWLGKIYTTPTIYLDCKDSTWIENEYAGGKKACFMFGDFRSATLSSDGQLDSVPIFVVSGTYSSNTQNQLVCDSSGTSYLPGGFLSPSLKQNAYGIWEFMFTRPTTAFDVFIAYIGINKAHNTTGGHWLTFKSDGSLISVRGGTGALFRTVAGIVPENVPAKITITRNYSGLLAVYINDVLAPADTGSNPIVENTTKESKTNVFVYQSGAVIEGYKKYLLP